MLVYDTIAARSNPGDPSSFRLSLCSNGADTEEDVTAQNIDTNHLRFRPGKEANKMLNNIDTKETG